MYSPCLYLCMERATLSLSLTYKLRVAQRSVERVIKGHEDEREDASKTKVVDIFIKIAKEAWIDYQSDET